MTAKGFPWLSSWVFAPLVFILDSHFVICTPADLSPLQVLHRHHEHKIISVMVCRRQSSEFQDGHCAASGCTRCNRRPSVEQLALVSR